mgnify:CR=1 FL=1
MDKIYTVNDLANLFNVTRDTILRYVRTKKIRSFKVGNYIRFTQEMVDEFINKHQRN